MNIVPLQRIKKIIDFIITRGQFSKRYFWYRSDGRL